MEEERVLEIPVEQIRPNPDQPRTEFDQDELISLAESIKEYGLKKPIIVFYSPQGSSLYTLIDGERRLRASIMAGLPTIKGYVRADVTMKKGSTLVDAIITNSLNSDLNPVEEARAFRKLGAKFSQAQIAKLVGKSQSYVSFRMRLLDLEPEVQDFFSKKKIPLDPIVVSGLLNLLPEKRISIARKFAQRNMTTMGMRRALTILSREQDDDEIDRFRKLKHAPAIEVAAPVKDSTSRILKLVNQSGVVTAWSIVEQAADETCKKCDLFDMASSSSCRDCPAVDLIKILTRLASA